MAVKKRSQPPLEIKIFQAFVESRLNCHKSCLTSEEREKAVSIRLDAARNRYIQSRHMLRKIVADAINSDPGDIDFKSGAHGKPYIPNGPFFNLSHTGNQIVCALCHDAEVGIDIEVIDSGLDVSKISKAVFSKLEQQQLEQTPSPDRSSAFHIGWTRKEAILKGLGYGLTTATEDFDVSLSPFSCNRLLVSRNPALKVSEWQLVDLPYFENTAGALAINSRRPKQLSLENFKH